MSDVLVTHALHVLQADTGDATKLGPNAWNAAQVFAGGVNGQVVVRDSDSPVGASWGTVSAGAATTDAGDLTSGTLPDARLAANIPRIVAGAIAANILGSAAAATLAAAAVLLATPRTINGVSFDGSANITLPAADLSGVVPVTRTVNGHALSANVTVTKTDVGLGSVENTALSTWAGSTSVTQIGPLTSLMVGGSLAPSGVEGYFASSSVADPRGVMTAQFSTDVTGARFHFRKARGTEAAPTTIVSGDTLGRIRFSGYDGANYLQMAGLNVVSFGTVTATRIPTYLTFSVASDATPSVLTEVLRLAPTVGVKGAGSTGTGWLGIGLPSTAGYGLILDTGSGNFSGANGNEVIGIQGGVSNSPTQPTTNNTAVFGVIGLGQWGGNQNSASDGLIYGGQFTGRLFGTASVRTAYGIEATVSNVNTSGVCATARAVWAHTNNDGTGTITNADAVRADVVGPGITTGIGFHVGTMNGGTVYGLKVDDLSAGTVDNFAIYTGQGKVHFGGALDVATATLTTIMATGAGSLTLSDGVSPGSLVIKGPTGQAPNLIDCKINNVTVFSVAASGAVGLTATLAMGGQNITGAGTFSGTGMTLSGNANFSTNLMIPTNGALRWNNGSGTRFLSPADGQLSLTNAAVTGSVGLDINTAAVLKVRTLAQSGYATVDALGYRVSGVAIDTEPAGFYDAGNSGTALTLNWNNSRHQRLVLTGNVTFTLSNPTDGARYVLHIGTGAGSFTGTWPAAVAWPGSVTPTLTATASKTDVVVLVYNATAAKYYGAISQNY